MCPNNSQDDHNGSAAQAAEAAAGGHAHTSHAHITRARAHTHARTRTRTRTRTHTHTHTHTHTQQHAHTHTHAHTRAHTRRTRHSQRNWVFVTAKLVFISLLAFVDSFSSTSSFVRLFVGSHSFQRTLLPQVRPCSKYHSNIHWREHTGPCLFVSFFSRSAWSGLFRANVPFFWHRRPSPHTSVLYVFHIKK